MRVCSTCSGAGRYTVLCAMRDDGTGGPAVIPCTDCNGTGTDVRPQDWIDQGQEARRQRILRGESLGDVARRLGVTPVEVGDMERGRRDPWRLLQAVVRRG